MNHNHAHNHDDHEQARIDRARRGEHTGDTLVDTLASTRPRPDRAFVTTLEERLLAEHQQHQLKKENPMQAQAAGTYTETLQMRLTVPLTLVAAMLALLIGGGLLLFMNQPDTQPDSPLPGAAQIQASATFTPTYTPSPTPPPSQTPVPTASPVGAMPVRPDATPTSPFDIRQSRNAEMQVILNGVPSWIPVQLMSAWWDGEVWHYEVTVNGSTFQVSELQLRPSGQPDGGPSVMPPTVPPPVVTASPIPVQPDARAFTYTVEPPFMTDAQQWVSVVIAQQIIPRGTQIEPDMLALVFWPQAVYDRAVANAPEILQIDLQALAGQYATTDILPYAPVRLGEIMPGN